eukprot:3257067-Amphidinium_carterae.1
MVRDNHKLLLFSHFALDCEKARLAKRCVNYETPCARLCCGNLCIPLPHDAQMPRVTYKLYDLCVQQKKKHMRGAGSGHSRYQGMFGFTFTSRFPFQSIEVLLEVLVHA